MRHRPVGQKNEVTATGWLNGVKSIGITAGASTPNNKIGETIVRICAISGLGAELEAVARASSE